VTDFFTVNHDIWSGKLLLALASIIILSLLSVSLSRIRMSVWGDVLTQEFELKSDQDHATGKSWECLHVLRQYFYHGDRVINWHTWEFKHFAQGGENNIVTDSLIDRCTVYS
jgi:hypothetical protein